MADKLSILTVKGAGDDNKVVLWERHAEHPDKKNPSDEMGEAFVVNDGKARKVAETATVKRMIADGLLVKGGGSNEAAPAVPRRPDGSATLTTSQPKAQ